MVQDVVEGLSWHNWHPGVGIFLQRLRLELCGRVSVTEFKVNLITWSGRASITGDHSSAASSWNCCAVCP